jgi:hypothetical protein
MELFVKYWNDMMTSRRKRRMEIEELKNRIQGRSTMAKHGG